jgi:hypothetical protein
MDEAGRSTHEWDPSDTACKSIAWLPVVHSIGCMVEVSGLRYLSCMVSELGMVTGVEDLD